MRNFKASHQHMSKHFINSHVSVVRNATMPSAPPDCEALTEQAIPAGIYLDAILEVTTRQEASGATVLDINHLIFDGEQFFELGESKYVFPDMARPTKGDMAIVLLAYSEDGKGDFVLRNELLYRAIINDVCGSET